jgi:DNA-binding XRE family transcriptional regulator
MFLCVPATMPGVDEDEGRQRLAQAVRAARLRAGLGKEGAARDAGISSITWSRVEDGLSVQDVKLAAVERVLAKAGVWEVGQAVRVRAGIDEPVGPVGDAPHFVAKTERTRTPVSSRGGNEPALWEEMARVRQEMDRLAAEVADVKDDVRAIREAVVGDGGA